MTKEEAKLAAARESIRVAIVTLVGDGEIPRMGEALTHPSYANETSMLDNQRLEFLGDSVLGLCVSEILARAFPDADEGALTRMRSGLVNAEALAGWARRVSLGDAIALGRGASAGGEREQTNVLADAVEAIVAAVFEARGLDGARALTSEIVREPLAEVSRLAERDPKSLLQEHVQKQGLPPPTYRVENSSGPQHDPTFVVSVLVGDRVLGEGEGRSKRAAERAAASNALERDLNDVGKKNDDVVD